MKVLHFVILLLAIACGGTSESTSYRDRAEQTYREGQELLEDGNYLEAMTAFNQVKNEFPFSSYAALSSLAVGEVYFREENTSKIDVFLCSKTEHPEVPTALFRK